MFRILNDVTISKKLKLGFFVIGIGISGLSIFGIVNSANIKRKATIARDQSSYFALLAKNMQIDAIQVQQWLTDIAATRGLPGFDDGFQMAEKHANEFRLKASEFKKLFAAINDRKAIAKIELLSKSFDEYYEMGKKMANEYISKGPEAGNIYMEKFDPFAEELTREMELLVASQANNLEKNMTIICKYSDLFVSTMLISGLLMLGISVFTGIVITRSIIKPLGVVLNSIDSIGAGDLTVKTAINSTDEFGRIGKSLDSTITSLNTVVKEIRGSTEKVASSASVLSTTSTQIAERAQEMTAQSATVASATEQTTTNITSISSTAEEMANSSNAVAAAIEEMSSSLNEVAFNCQNEFKIASDANMHMRSSKELISKLNISSRDIENIVGVINDIASKTNLLALNATIEAASAGNAGKGFAVVAGEIKKLSQQTAQATVEIKKQIVEMQTSSKAVVKEIELVSGIIEEVSVISQSIVSAVEEQSATVNEIAKNVSFANTGAQEVARNVAESAKGLSEIAKNISGMSIGAAETANGVGQIRGSATDLEKLSESLKSLVLKFKLDTVEILKERT